MPQKNRHQIPQKFLFSVQARLNAPLLHDRQGLVGDFREHAGGTVSYPPSVRRGDGA